MALLQNLLKRPIRLNKCSWRWRDGSLYQISDFLPHQVDFQVFHPQRLVTHEHANCRQSAGESKRSSKREGLFQQIALTPV